MINRESTAYRIGRFCGKLVLIGLGYLIGKRWTQRPINKGFPEKK